MKRLVVWEDTIEQLKSMKLNDSIIIERDCRHTGKHGYVDQKHLERNYPLLVDYLVCENISHFSDEPERRFGQNTYIGYTADVHKYAERKLFHIEPAFSASKMPKELGRFVLKALRYTQTHCYSTSWFRAYIEFELVEIREGVEYVD